MLSPDEGLPNFGNEPKNLKIHLPREIRNPERMFFGDDVDLGPNSILKATLRYPRSSLEGTAGFELPSQTFSPKITIGDRVSATAGLHIAAFDEIVIEEDVLIAANVFMSDGLHGFENANVPYKYQGFFRISPILIKRGSWIGQNVVIMPGVTVGELSIIGANSVVTKSIPDRCIAVGSPARVVKQWNEAAQGWVPVENGNGQDLRRSAVEERTSHE